MFDKLVESTKQKPQGRNKFYFVTCLIYSSSLSVLAVATILWFNPALAEANTTAILLAPPPVPIVAAPPEASPITKAQPDPGFVEPKTPPKEIMDATKVPPKPPIQPTGPVILGPSNLNNSNTDNIALRSGPHFGDDVEAPPPPPPPTPVTKPTPPPEPPPVPTKPLTVSSGVLQGKAIHRPQPPYPQIARAIRASGAVPVQITISEEGRVLSAHAVSGHPTLQQAAQQAAMQWVFTPTVLSGKPVKVSGVISFNFILN